MNNDRCSTSRLKEQSTAQEEEEEVEKEKISTTTRPAKRARTSFTVDQTQVPTATVITALQGAEK